MKFCKLEHVIYKKLTIILIKLKLQEIEKDNIVTSEEIDFISSVRKTIYKFFISLPKILRQDTEIFEGQTREQPQKDGQKYRTGFFRIRPSLSSS